MIIKVLKAGLFTTVQDLGRPGLRFYGIPASGAMDAEACKHANLVLGMSVDNPVLEFTLLPAELEFKFDTTICLTGADMKWRINDQPVKRYQPLDINAADILSGEHSCNGFRSYLAIQGKIQSSVDYGSVSTYHYAGIGGFAGKAIQQNQLLQVTKENKIKEESLTFSSQDYQSIQTIDCTPGPEWQMLTALSRKKIIQDPFTISSESNRMGAKLIDNKLNLMPGAIIETVPVIPGMVQLPSRGYPIVLLQDGQTTGGYPRIIYIEENELNRFNQIPIGDAVRFNCKT